MALLSATGVRADPLLNHNFIVSLIDSSSTLGALGALAGGGILDVALGGFSECTGLEMSMQPEEYKEGGRNGAVLKFPSRITWTNLTLKKGIGIGTALWDWHYGFVEGRGRRRDGSIMLLNEQRAAEQHLVLPARPAGQVHRPVAQRDAEQRGDRGDRDRARGHPSGCRCRRLRPPPAQSRDWWVSKWMSKSAN